VSIWHADCVFTSVHDGFFDEQFPGSYYGANFRTSTHRCRSLVLLWSIVSRWCGPTTQWKERNGMRFKTLLGVAMGLSLVGSTGTAWANSKSCGCKEKQTTQTRASRDWWYKSQKKAECKQESECKQKSRSNACVPRGGSTANRGYTPNYGYRSEQSEVEVKAGRLGMASERIVTGPYQYVWTNSQGRYDYFADRYDYPYAFGAVPAAPPAGVYGFVPPEAAGGGPIRYFRERTSWSQEEPQGGFNHR